MFVGVKLILNFLFLIKSLQSGNSMLDLLNFIVVVKNEMTMMI